MYDPSVGRWLEEDPEGFAAGDPNLYRYVRNDPTNATDPSGLDEEPSSPVAAAVNAVMRRAQEIQAQNPSHVNGLAAAVQSHVDAMNEITARANEANRPQDLGELVRRQVSLVQTTIRDLLTRQAANPPRTLSELAQQQVEVATTVQRLLTQLAEIQPMTFGELARHQIEFTAIINRHLWPQGFPGTPAPPGGNPPPVVVPPSNDSPGPGISTFIIFGIVVTVTAAGAAYAAPIVGAPPIYNPNLSPAHNTAVQMEWEIRWPQSHLQHWNNVRQAALARGDEGVAAYAFNQITNAEAKVEGLKAYWTFYPVRFLRRSNK